MPTARRMSALIPTLAASLAIAATLPACVGVSTNPSIYDDPNARPVASAAIVEITSAAVRHVVSRYPVQGSYAVNLPSSIPDHQAELIIKRLNDDANLLTEATQSLPVFHVESVRVLGDEAIVQVHRPVTLASAEGKPVTQAIEVKCRGGVQPWRVVATRGLMLGAIPAPPYYLRASSN